MKFPEINNILSKIFDSENFDEIIIAGITVILILISIILFAWNQYFSIGATVNHNILGTCGDFVGGFIGTILSFISVILVIKTFKYQRKVTEDNKTQLEIQRFNDLFFELLAHYQKIIENLTESTKHIHKQSCKTIMEECVFEGKEYFDIKKKQIQSNFKESTSRKINVHRAISDYMEFYIENSSKLSPYFRIIYRIYDLLDTSTLPENEKKNYLKIFRSQLSDSELFFIRYNAMSFYGNNFVKYLNKYHIIKHLQFLDMLEYKKFWKGLNDVERAGMNIILQNLEYVIRKIIIKNESEYTNSWDFHKYRCEIDIRDCQSIQLKIIINKLRKNRYADFAALGKFTNIQIGELFNAFLMDLFVYSNYGRFNKEVFNDKALISENKKETIITCTLSVDHNYKLCLNDGTLYY